MSQEGIPAEVGGGEAFEPKERTAKKYPGGAAEFEVQASQPILLLEDSRNEMMPGT